MVVDSLRDNWWELSIGFSENTTEGRRLFEGGGEEGDEEPTLLCNVDENKNVKVRTKVGGAKTGCDSAGPNSLLI